MPPGATLRLAAPEPGAVTLAAVDGGALRPVDGTLTAPTAGDHWLVTAGLDRAGNRSELRWLRLRIDDAPPEIELLAEPTPVEVDGRAWVAPGTMVRAAARDALAGVARLDLRLGEAHVGDQTTELTPRDVARFEIAVPDPDSVDTALEARADAADRVGHVAPTRTLALHVDGTPPTGEIVLRGPWVEGDGYRIVSPTTRLEAVLDDVGSGLSEAGRAPRLDGEVVEGGAWPELRTLIDGRPHRAEIDVRDRVGNTARLGPLDVLVDAEGPLIRWRLEEEGAENDDGERFYDSPVTLVAVPEDDHSGVAAMERREGEDWIAMPESGRLGVRGPGLLMRARDRVGNIREQRVLWRIDHEPPELHLLDAKGNPIPDKEIVLRPGDVLSIDVDDRGCGVADAFYRLDGGPRLEIPKLLTFPDRRGSVRLRVEAVDRLGHRSTATWRLTLRRSTEDPS